MGITLSFADGFRQGFQPPRKKKKKKRRATSLTSEESRKLKEYMRSL